MKRDEEFVRANWEDVRIYWQPRTGDYSKVVYWWVVANGKGPLAQSVHSSEAECYANLAEFTRDRLEEIRQLREEIGQQQDLAAMKGMDLRQEITADYADEDYLVTLTRDLCEYYRTSTRLESAMAELRRGMKEGEK